MKLQTYWDQLKPQAFLSSFCEVRCPACWEQKKSITHVRLMGVGKLRINHSKAQRVEPPGQEYLGNDWSLPSSLDYASATIFKCLVCESVFSLVFCECYDGVQVFIYKSIANVHIDEDGLFSGDLEVIEKFINLSSII